jgi:N-formylglutamate deformylase
MDTYRFRAGSSPLLISMPHVGTHIPANLAAAMTPAGLEVPDTDWHVDLLYDFLDELGAGVLQATHSRYVIDLNRTPTGEALYPGARNTELCPTTRFDDQPIYRPDLAPDGVQIAERRNLYWQPYHDRLALELAAIKAKHGYALLFDAHSIRSRVPRFFEGRLWDINLGSGDGVAASPAICEAVLDVAAKAESYTSILNGRFKGGYITRRYGRPIDCIEAIQLELSEITYMDEDPPFALRQDLAAGIRPVLRRILEALMAAGAKRYRGAAAVRTAV